MVITCSVNLFSLILMNLLKALFIITWEDLVACSTDLKSNERVSYRFNTDYDKASRFLNIYIF